MKLTNTQSMKAKSGMTLLELTVVILVLLSLISILFVGARAWKKGSDRAANIMNIRNVQQAVRGQQNMRGLAVAAPLPEASIIGDAGFLKEPTPPDAGIVYAGKYLNAVPAAGVLYLDPTYTAPLIKTDYHPENDAVAQW
jgi:prepilin-type N-terminal cleavage/methylation domain-containing protein